jgi:tetratricopeptide (TPR) repeat protein
MALKDFASVLISALALLVSALGAAFSITRGKYEERHAEAEERRTLRTQLSDVLSRILETTVENAKIFYSTADGDPNYRQAISIALGQRQTVLLHQAMYLADKIPELVTAVEFNTLAATTAEAGQLIEAEQYHKKAIETSSNDVYKSRATRSYAVFLFSQRRFEEGREQFRKAVSLLSGGNNLVRYDNGISYQFWGWNECNVANAAKRAEELFESAQNEFNGIDIEPIRRKALQDLENAKNSSRAPAAYPRPASAGAGAA